MKIYLVFALIILVTVGLNTMNQKFLKQQWSLWLAYEIPALAMLLFLGIASIPPNHEWFSDFRCYYSAGRLIIQAPYKLYDFAGAYGFVNIPILAILFVPFGTLNKIIAAILFTIIGLLAVITTCYFLVKLTKVVGGKRILLIGLFVINGPLYHSLWYGNLSHFMPLLLLAAWFCLEKKRQVWLGIILAIGTLIKIPLFLPIVYFAIRGKWQVIAGFGAATLVVVGASMLLFGLDLHLAWLHHLGQFSGKAVNAYNDQSVDGFLARLLLKSNGELRNWEPIAVDLKFKVIRYALLSLLVGTTILVCWRSKPPTTLAEENLEFCIVLCLSLLISPISWTHYYTFLLLPFALYIGNKLAVPEGGLWFTSMVVCILLTSLPVISASLTNPFLRVLYFKLLVSHYFFGGLLLLGLLLAARWRTASHSRLSPDYEILFHQ